MGNAIKELCALSVLCGAALSIAPEGGVKKVMGILCTAALLAALLSPLKGLDYSVYSLELSRLRQREQELSDRTSDMNQRLNRLVIEEKLETYIMDKAAELGVELSGAKVRCRWSSEGFYVPESAELYLSSANGDRERLSGIICSELGIGRERQSWIENS